jgi:hypothetical protein
MTGDGFGASPERVASTWGKVMDDLPLGAVRVVSGSAKLGDPKYSREGGQRLEMTKVRVGASVWTFRRALVVWRLLLS